MSNRSPILIAILSTVLLLAAFWYWYSYRQKEYVWDDSWARRGYLQNNDQPYGGQVFRRLMSVYFSDSQVVNLTTALARSLPLDSGANNTYVFIGEHPFWDSSSTQQILEFVRVGNTAFISSKTLSSELTEVLTSITCDEERDKSYGALTATSARLSLSVSAVQKKIIFPLTFARKNEPETYEWNYIPDTYGLLCEREEVTYLGRLNDSLTNFISIFYGRGRFLLHTCPLAFTNYQLLRPEARPYAEGVLQHLNFGKIYWDAFSHAPAYMGNSNFRGRLPREHILRYFLQQPALAWAWYILIGIAFIYVLFRARRRQRIIPVLPKNENSSVEFIRTIANLYFRQQNYDVVTRQIMRLFLTHVRERYNLVVPLPSLQGSVYPEAGFVTRLAATAEVREASVAQIFTFYANCLNYQPNEQMMVDLHLAIEDFYKHAK